VCFVGEPHMLAFLPYPMSNEHAMNLMPFLAVSAQLPQGRSAGWRRFLVILVVVLTYLVCGALIGLAGAATGLHAS
jgi:hypothetical protein